LNHVSLHTIPLRWPPPTWSRIEGMACCRLLKGQCHEIFNLWFFHQSTPPRALTHRLKPFCIWLRIRQENRHYSSFLGVNDTVETISAVSMTPLKPFHRCQWHRWNRFSGVIDTAETLDLILIAVSAVSLTPLKPFQWCHWYRGNRFSGVIDTAETTMILKFKIALGFQPQNLFFAEFKRCQWHRWNNFRGVNDTAETVSAVSMTPWKQLWGSDLKF
jgi:hypothetical protein